MPWETCLWKVIWVVVYPLMVTIMRQMFQQICVDLTCNFIICHFSQDIIALMNSLVRVKTFTILFIILSFLKFQKKKMSFVFVFLQNFYPPQKQFSKPFSKRYLWWWWGEFGWISENFYIWPFPMPNIHTQIFRLIFMYFLKEVVERRSLIKDQSIFPFGDFFINSYNLFFWRCISVVKRKLIL